MRGLARAEVAGETVRHALDSLTVRATAWRRARCHETDVKVARAWLSVYRAVSERGDLLPPSDRGDRCRPADGHVRWRDGLPGPTRRGTVTLSFD